MTSSPPSPPTVATGQPSLHKVMEQQRETTCSRENERSLEVSSEAPSSNEGGTPPLENLGSLEDQSQALRTQQCQTQPQHGSSVADLSTRDVSTHSDPDNAPIHTKPADATKPGDGTVILESSTQAGDTAGVSRTRRSEFQPLAPAPLAPFPLMPLMEQGTAFVSRLLPTGSLENISMMQVVLGDNHTEVDSIQDTKQTSPSVSPTNAPPKSISPKTGSNLRRGKWTIEEESYVARVIQDFNSGFLDAPAGTTLRSYLSEKLQCDPMRITKKFTGEACIGKRVFHPAVRSAANSSIIDKAQGELDTLEKRWRRRLEMQQRESAKKAAASAAAVAVGSRTNQAIIQSVPLSLLSSGVSPAEVAGTQMGQSVVTQAASWLDRANAILKGVNINALPVAPMKPDSFSDEEMPSQSPGNSTPDSAIENEMKEVERLIHEGPRIQKTAAGLPNLLTSNQRLSGMIEGPPSPPEPADKRMRTGAGGTISGAEDAEALVGFLRSVRAATRQDTS